MAGFCTDYAEIFYGDLYRLIVGAVLGIILSIIYFLLGSRRSGKDYRDTLILKTCIAPVTFFLFLECAYAVLSLVCQFNVIHILGAGNLDTVGGYQVFDIEWVKIGLAIILLAVAFMWFHGYQNMHMVMIIFTFGGWALFNFVICRSISYDAVWGCFAVSALLIVLAISMRIASSAAFSLKDWKMYVSELHTLVYMVANSILVMVANPVYNIRGSTFRAFFYPSITFVVAVIVVLELWFLLPRRTGRNGDVAALYGDLAYPEEKKASESARQAMLVRAPPLWSR